MCRLRVVQDVAELLWRLSVAALCGVPGYMQRDLMQLGCARAAAALTVPQSLRGALAPCTTLNSKHLCNPLQKMLDGILHGPS